MFKNYLKLTFRHLFREKLYSVINIVGLSLGAAVAILLFLFVRNEWSYDTFHEDHEQLYRVWVREYVEGEEYFNTRTPFILGTELADNFPEVESLVQFFNGNNLVRQGTFLEQEPTLVASPSFLEVFNFPLKAGLPATALDEPTDVVLTEEMAMKYFGEAAPVGKTIDIQMGGDWQQFQVSGIIEAPPPNSSIDYHILLPLALVDQLVSQRAQTSWTIVLSSTYVCLQEGTDPAALRAKVERHLLPLVPEGYGPGEYQVGFQPLADIHLNNEFPPAYATVSDWRYPYIMGVIGLLVLLLAGINYVTLAVGRSVARAKEVGVRKVTGATRGQLMRQFWSEALLVAALSVGVGVLVAELALPAFNQLADQRLVIEYNASTGLILAGLVLSIGLIAGAYPALVLSGFSPIRTLRGTVSKLGRDKHLVLRGLVGAQFVLSVGLIICTLVIREQMQYLQNKNLGYHESQQLILPYNDRPSNEKGLRDIYQEGVQKAELLEQQLAGVEDVVSLATSSHTFGTPGWTKVDYRDPATNQVREFSLLGMDEEFIPTMDIQLTAGRNFSRDIGTDAEKGVIINETFARRFGWEQYIDQPLPPPFEGYRLVGITENFNYASLHTAVEPLMMVMDFFPIIRIISNVNYGDMPSPKITIRLDSEDLSGTVQQIKEAWTDVAPNQPFNFEFVDDALQAQYQSEQRLRKIVSAATILAILIAALGLFGIATLTTARRTKEIGVRKVFGATELDIVLLLNRSFTWLVLGATLLAAPLSWYLMQQWLSDFEYQAGVSPLLIVAAGLAALLIAWLAVSYQSFRAARRNPVEALRYE